MINGMKPWAGGKIMNHWHAYTEGNEKMEK